MVFGGKWQFGPNLFGDFFIEMYSSWAFVRDIMCFLCGEICC